MKNGSGFDNLDEVCLGPEPEPAEKGADTPGMKQRRLKREQQFVMVPMGWVDKLAETKHLATYPVAVYLLRLSWKRKSKTVSLPNSGLKELGVSRQRKWEALQELKAKKLVTIEAEPKKAPRITLLLSNPSRS
jgi:hypothetical protein